MTKVYVILSLILFSSLRGGAQDLVFEHYNEINGLSNNSIRSIVQDNNGFLWLGTFGGLNRFDGYDFKEYKSSENTRNTFQDNDIAAMIYDNLNHLWIGTNNGLTKYDIAKSTFKTYHANKKSKNTLVGNKIRALFIDKSKRLWIGTKDNGLCYLNTKTETFQKVKIDSIENVRAIYQSKDDKIWFSTFSNGIYCFNINKDGEISKIKNYHLNYPNKLFNGNPENYFLIEDKKGKLFAGTKNGLFKFQESDDKFELVIQNGEELDYFRSITIGPNGNYWIGTLNGIIECENLDDISINKYKRYVPDIKNSNSLANNYIISLFFDKSNMLWIGTENGLDKYDPFENQFKTIRSDFIVNSKLPIVSSFGKTYDNNLLFGTHTSGLFIRKKGKFLQVLKDYLKISSIYTTDGKLFYIGLWNGKVLRYNYFENKSDLLDVGFKNSPIFSFCKISSNALLIASYGEGLIEYNTKTKQYKFIRNDVLAEQDINKLVLSSGNILWIATENGILKYDFSNNQIKKYKSNDTVEGLSSEIVNDIVIDKDDKIWAGTRQGLNYYDPNRDEFVIQQTPKELKNSWITDIAIDSLGIMWLNMNYNQIGRYNRKENDLSLFYVKNGIRSNAVNKRGFLFYNNSKIYLGGDKEIIYFSPSQIKENTNSPPPIISEFKIQNKEVLPDTEIGGQMVLNEDLNYTKSVNLNYNNRNFSITFSSPSYVKERLNKFEYKLEGFDTEWNTVNSNSRTVQYTNLFPKSYILKIRAANSNGFWSDETAYNININRPFWLTYKALILVLLFISILFYLIRKQIKLRLKLKQELLLEKVKRDRDEKLNNEKLRFFTNISHELRTPLTLILGPVKQLLGQENTSDFERSRFDFIYQNTNRLLRLVNQILDFRRAETGVLKLQVSKVEILISTKNIFNSFIELAQTKNINFNLNTDDTTLECWIDTDKYNKILYNLLSNAMKFTNDYGNVGLFIGYKDGEDKKLIIEVSDDGIGIPIESQEKIFSRFYQAQNSRANTTGTGIGLSLVKALVEIHKGDIKVTSAPNEGSIFTVELPVNKEAYTEDEIFDFVPDKEDNEKLIQVPQLNTSPKETKGKRPKNNTDIKHKILVIEDNSELRRYAVEYLSDFYKVYEAENGKEGLEVCRKVKPVLCVVDVMMPIMDGFEFVEELKNDEYISHTAVILLTALAENENRIKGYKIGVDGYLVKPFYPSLLKTRIDNIIKIHFDLKQKFSGDIESDVIALAHSQIDIDLISKIKKIIEDNMSNPDLAPRYLCSELGMSSSKLYQKITQLTDLSANEFIRTIRLKKSAQLLKTKNYNVSEVANMVGFNDPLYFSKCFKKQFGYSPSKLIK